MTAMTRARRTLAAAQRRGRSRASLPVAALQELLQAAEQQATYELAGNRMVQAIRGALETPAYRASVGVRGEGSDG